MIQKHKEGNGWERKKKQNGLEAVNEKSCRITCCRTSLFQWDGNSAVSGYVRSIQMKVVLPTHLLQPSLGQYLFTLSAGTGGMQLMLNVQIEGGRRNYHLLWNAVWHADSCACIHTHTHAFIYVHTKRPRRRWGGKVFQPHPKLHKGSEWIL